MEIIFRTVKTIINNYEKLGWAGIGFLLRRKLLPKGQICIKPKNLRFPFFLRNKTTDIPAFYQIFLDLDYEFEYESYFDKQPATIIDCGANIGASAVYFKNRFPNATIIAVEPEKTNFDLLRINTGHYEDIHCLNTGIWSKCTLLEIVDTGLGNWGYITKETDQESDRSIRAVSIDGIMKQFGLTGIDILKIDIESSEKEVFSSNYEKWLPQTKILIIELHDRMLNGCSKSFFKALENYDYSISIIGENIICIKEKDLHQTLT